MKENTQAKLEQNHADIDRLLEEQKKLKAKLNEPQVEYGDYGLDGDTGTPVILLYKNDSLTAYWLNSKVWTTDTPLYKFRNLIKRGNIFDDIK